MGLTRFTIQRTQFESSSVHVQWMPQQQEMLSKCKFWLLYLRPLALRFSIAKFDITLFALVYTVLRGVSP